MMIGSQWWCLRRRTVERCWILRLAPRCDAVLPHHLDPRRDLLSDRRAPCRARKRNPHPHADLLMFTDYGMPVTFYNDQYDLLLARIICSPARSAPRRWPAARLGALWAARGVHFPSRTRAAAVSLSDRARAHRAAFRPAFLGNRGQSGPRAHAADGGQEMACRQAADQCDPRPPIPAVDYLFNEMSRICPIWAASRRRWKSAPAPAGAAAAAVRAVRDRPAGDLLDPAAMSI
jgi:hypothetical protein